jgi:hypothetical protein
VALAYRSSSRELAKLFFGEYIEMTITISAKYRFVHRALRSAFATVLIIGIFGCGAGNSSDLTPGTDSVPLQPAPTSVIPTPTTTTTPKLTPTISASTNTAVALAKFWDRYGAKDSFPPKYAELLTKLLEAEDKVVATDYQGARLIIDDLIKKNPLMDNSNAPANDEWYSNYNKMQARNPRPNFGEPGLYAHLRMLDEIIQASKTNPMLGKTPIQMAIVMPACSDTVDKTGQTTNRLLNPEIEKNSYEAVRQSLRLFQSYILAISGGQLRLELNFYKVNSCLQIRMGADQVNYDGNAPIRQLPPGVIEKTDMFWLIYPTYSDLSLNIGGGSGMGGFGSSGKPVFQCEDDWVITKRAPDQGVGPRTEVERRIYLPEWLQHEFFHHLFGSWPELKLEGPKYHEWFDRNYWPKDFVGKIEEDYYSESLRKRLYQATPSIAQKLQRANK